MKPVFKILLFCGILAQTIDGHSQMTEAEEELISPSRSFSSDINYIMDLNIAGTFSTGEELPFWMYHNRRGRFSQDSNLSTWLSVKHVIFINAKSYLISGAGLQYADGSQGGVALDELYLHFQNPGLYATIGRKQQRELYNGLSASNQNILWSLNSRPLWGIQVGTAKPIFITGKDGLGFEASWHEYWMGKNDL